jgi:hypothetical protein
MQLPPNQRVQPTPTRRCMSVRRADPIRLTLLLSLQLHHERAGTTANVENTVTRFDINVLANDVGYVSLFSQLYYSPFWPQVNADLPDLRSSAADFLFHE